MSYAEVKKGAPIPKPRAPTFIEPLGFGCKSSSNRLENTPKKRAQTPGKAQKRTSKLPMRPRTSMLRAKIVPNVLATAIHGDPIQLWREEKQRRDTHLRNLRRDDLQRRRTARKLHDENNRIEAFDRGPQWNDASPFMSSKGVKYKPEATVFDEPTEFGQRIFQLASTHKATHVFDPIGQLHTKNHLKALQFLEAQADSNSNSAENMVTIEQERKFMQWKRSQGEIAAEESFHGGETPGAKKKSECMWAKLQGQAQKVQISGEASFSLCPAPWPSFSRHPAPLTSPRWFRTISLLSPTLRMLRRGVVWLPGKQGTLCIR